MNRPLASNPLCRRAFTLIEVIVVIILLAIVSAVVLPRALDNGRKRAEQTARSLASLLTAVAQRDATAFEPMSVAYEPEKNTIEVRVLRARGGERRWTPDLFIDSVALRDARVRSARLDDNPLGEQGWSIEVPVDRPRPAIEVALEADVARGDAGAWRVTLEPGASAARVREAEAAETGHDAVERTVVDLDALGMGESAW